MIRALWVGLVICGATLFFGLIVIIGAFLRVRSQLYPWATRTWSRTILRASGVRVRVHGLASIDWQTPGVLVSNHISFYDVFAIAAVLPAPFWFVGKKELDSIPFFGRAWKAAGHISIDRSDRQKAIASLQRAGEQLRRQRGTLIIFPEGTRSRDGGLLPFKKGAFTLAVEAEIQILPTVVVGSSRIVRPGPRIRPHPIDIYFGPPIAPMKDQPVDALISAVRERMVRMLDGRVDTGTVPASSSLARIQVVGHGHPTPEYRGEVRAAHG